MKYLYCEANVRKELDETEKVLKDWCEKLKEKEDEISNKVSSMEVSFSFPITFVLAAICLYIAFGLIKTDECMFWIIGRFIPSVIGFVSLLLGLFCFGSFLYQKLIRPQKYRYKEMVDKEELASQMRKSIQKLTDDYLRKVENFRELCRFSDYLLRHKEDHIQITNTVHENSITVEANTHPVVKTSDDCSVRFTTDIESFEMQLDPDTFRKVFPDSNTCDLSWMQAKKDEMMQYVKREVLELLPKAKELSALPEYTGENIL